ncbi:ferritin [Blattabacterium cuenoti]|uniref:ferritin n=1 Tax=Blattabacterium cuenoti TaxID=1653831 RepID=UPI00163CC884|nr:ferritin [Blattabacterium cuenoti]
MFSNTIQLALVNQLNKELESSLLYLSMASWVDNKIGLKGISEFLYDHSDEERDHMFKIIRYINKRNGEFSISVNSNNLKKTYSSLKNLFQKLFEHEKSISKEINLLVELSLKEKDYFTYHFLQWFIEEQIEEETLSKMFLDKIKLIGENNVGLYLFDKDIKKYYAKNVN